MSQTSLSENLTFIPPAVYVAKEKTTKCYPRETHHARLFVFDEGLCPDLQDVRDALIPELCCEGFDLHAMGLQIMFHSWDQNCHHSRKSKRALIADQVFLMIFISTILH